MDGSGGQTVGRCRKRESGVELDLPAVLARLDEPDPEAQQTALEQIQETLEDEPTRCLPTVPKLRALLRQPDRAFLDQVAYCLAELAAASPTDVAPSADAIASFAAAHESHEATPDLLRCLAAVAAERPAALAAHVDALASGLERDEPAARADAAKAIARVAADQNSLSLPRNRLLTALEDENPRVRANACAALGHGNATDTRESLEVLVDDDPESSVRERAKWALERLACRSVDGSVDTDG
ncbi:HEAT repeat domain-containing protein [Natronobacterium gregoryi]|uniref:HEAT repeat domain-containing protein n=2 Tax=Natronobacterium gregoryi TaxID=44930 RepID=L0AKI6_NATGS|nr:HEAT repeat domain-containing protein [Natronobacterium gregoryi]AFZ73969.1 HEAT repeat protein [Natronobacterium gregoryi SP2]PLK19548.1 HEAT repeat domain-containing protein [Natronobacterium gregoryi SP2]SFJ47416.1 HEAT repeat-containing protein [Natronobacterium gregoryi]